MWITPSPNNPILIAAAVSAEMRSLIGGVEEQGGKAGAWPVYFDVRPGVSVVLTGIGGANAAGATAWVMAQRRFPVVLSIGIAGSLPGSGLALSDVIVATESVFYEEGIDLPDGPGDVNDLGFSLIEAPWSVGNRVLGDEGLIDDLQEQIPGMCRLGRIATVSRWSGTDRAADAVIEHTNAAAESMEGAAVSLTAQRLGARFAEIRIISNTCGDRIRQQWDMAAALHRVDTVIKKLLD